MLLRLTGYIVLSILGDGISFAQESGLKQDSSLKQNDLYFFDPKLEIIPLDSGLFSMPDQENQKLKNKILEDMKSNEWKYSYEMPYYDPSETFRSYMPNADVIRDSIDYTLLIKRIPMREKDNVSESPEKDK